MYNELVKRLREIHPEEFGDKWDFAFACQQAMHEAADAIEELQKQRDEWESHAALAESFAQSWIPVTERLPEDKQTCLIWYEYYHCSLKMVLPEYGIGFYLSMCDMWYGDPSTGKDVKVLYWMPLPEPPKEE